MLAKLSRLAKAKSQPLPTPALSYPHIELYHWSPRDGTTNFGDRLSEVITRQLLALNNRSLDDQVATSARLLAIGSILHFSRDGDHVWGSGWNGKIAEDKFLSKTLQVHAVRGPLTAEFLRKRGIAVPDIFGDPGLLVPHLFKGRFTVQPANDYVVVPNLHDLNLVNSHPKLVSPLWGWNVVVERIMQAKFVLASSLHGLIIAEAFGIPARYVRLSQTEDLFKYRDYYLGSGRTESEFEAANSLEEGLEMGGAPAIRFDATRLMKAFPLHLWEKQFISQQAT